MSVSVHKEARKSSPPVTLYEKIPQHASILRKALRRQYYQCSRSHYQSHQAYHRIPRNTNDVKFNILVVDIKEDNWLSLDAESAQESPPHLFPAKALLIFTPKCEIRQRAELRSLLTTLTAKYKSFEGHFTVPPHNWSQYSIF